jgi:hypothetical protein
MRRLAIPVLIVVLHTSRAAAQTPDDSGYVKISPAVGVHYGTPLKWSVAAGGLFDFRGPHNDGVIAMAEMGQGGAEASVGYFRMMRFGQGFDLRLAGIRTGPDPRDAAPETTYLGATMAPVSAPQVAPVLDMPPPRPVTDAMLRSRFQ